MAEGWGGYHWNYGDQRPSSSRSSESRRAAAASERMFCTSQECSESASDIPDTREFEKLRQNCLRRGQPFRDPNFELVGEIKGKSIQWERPQRIAGKLGLQPKFFVEGAERFDVNQGNLGDCYMLAALACLSDPDQRDLFNRVVPPGQSFDRGWYAGVFHFNFWHMGRWEKVIVDDLLPTRGGKLILNRSFQMNEFWAALLEKAYAKFYGSYEAIEGGRTADAFAAFTGGVTETYHLKGQGALDPNHIYKILLKAFQRKSVVGCGIHKDLPENNGLFDGHAYSLTAMETVTTRNEGRCVLVRIRNPWGNDQEWTGAWADGSPEWQRVSSREKKRIGLMEKGDGEFWMSFQEFLENFDSLTVCNVKPDCPEGIACHWHSFEFTESSRTNPQFLLELNVPDKGDSPSCTFLVQLMQSDRQSTGGRKKELSPVGFTIYRKTISPQTRNYQWSQVQHTGDHLTCQVVQRFELPRGSYCVVPYTKSTRGQADFYIRFFFEEGNTASLRE